MKSRVQSIFRHLDDGVDLIVLTNSVEPHIDMSFFYATSLTDGLFEGCSALLAPDGGCEVVTSALEEQAAKKSGLPLHVYRKWDDRKKLLRKVLGGHRRIGVNYREATHGAVAELQKLARKARFVDVSGALSAARSVKDDDEVALIRKACDIASRAFADTLPFIGKGRTEAQVSAELAYAMQRRGATGPSFRTIVGSGPNGAEPHYTAGPRRIEKGDLIVMDFGAVYRMYVSDITRTLVVGPPSPEQKRMYNVVRRAQRIALKAMRPRVRWKTVDAAARSYIDSTKYKGRFIHGLGHSIGLAVHDGVSATYGGQVVLRSNMIMTNEPGVYIPGYGGVRIEDDVLITPSGPKVLSSARRDLIEV